MFKIKNRNFETLLSDSDLDWICSNWKSNLKCVATTGNSVNNNSEFLKKLITEQKEIKQSLEFISSQYDSIRDLLEELGSVKEENCKLKLKVSELELKYNRLEQYSKNFNVEIYGLPQISNENTYDVAQKCFKQ